MRLLCAVIAFVTFALTQDARELLTQGVEAYKTGRYADAVDAFQRVVDLNPTDVEARLYLATAFMSHQIQGVVRFSVIIGKEGRVQNATLISGHPLLVEAAREAVQQWECKPTLLNGQPVEVVTMIDGNFSLQP